MQKFIYKKYIIKELSFWYHFTVGLYLFILNLICAKYYLNILKSIIINNFNKLVI